MKKWYQTYRFALLSGILIGTSYIPFPPWASVFFLVPLWLTWLKNPNPKYVFISGWITQFVLTLIGFHWIAHTTVEYGHMPMAVGILVLLGFCAHANLHFALAGWVWVKLFQKDLTSVRSLLALAILTFFFETYWPQIFDWNSGYSFFWARLPVFQLSDIWGFQGLSLIVYVFNAYFTKSALSDRNKKLRFGFGALAFLVLNILGLIWSARLKDPDQKLRVAIVQANIGNFEKFLAEKNADFRAPVVTKFYEMSKNSIIQSGKPDLMIWPETAFPSNLHASALDGSYAVQLKDFIKLNQLNLFTGGYTEIPEGAYFNSIYLFDSEANIKGVYHKSHLLAFGEYFPLSDYFPFLKKLIDEISDFGRGDGPAVLIHNGIKLGPQVCYEGLFPEFSRAQSNLGAQIFVNVTNDSWFGHTFEPNQHLYMTLARAVEFRRPLIRSTNTGISSIVTARGDVILKGPQEIEWVGNQDVPYESNPRETFYAKFGQRALIPVALFCLIAIFIAYVRKSRLE